MQEKPDNIDKSVVGTRPAYSTQVSLYWELRWLLLAGIIIFSTGIGGLLYESQGNLAHFLALLSIATISVSCFTYAYKKKSPYSNLYVEEKDSFFDFIVLLGALTMLTTVAYLQFRFHLFGSKYGLATFIPMVCLFFAAYYFDHQGVLGMAVTNLATWAGVVASPRSFGVIRLLMSSQLVATGLFLAVLLELLAWLSEKKKWKPHFSMVYRWAALNLCFISILTGMFNLVLLPWTVLLIVCACYYYWISVKEKSFGQLLCTGTYVFIGFGYIVIRELSKMSFTGMGPVYLAIFYFIGSSALFGVFLMKQYKKLKNDHLQ